MHAGFISSTPGRHGPPSPIGRGLGLLALTLCIPPAFAGITEPVYHEVLADVGRLYVPELDRIGARLQIGGEWQSEQMQASVSRQEDRRGELAVVSIAGGIARHRAITADAFALVVCHEIGHHLGGPPTVWKYSVEGQADYFAASHCLPRLFLGALKFESDAARKAPAFVLDACRRAYDAPEQRTVCVRIAMAGQALSRVFAQRRGLPVPRFDTPEALRVRQTMIAAPSPQCRLDTYFAAARCYAPPPASPGGSGGGSAAGACRQASSPLADARPRCWFKAEGAEQGATLEERREAAPAAFSRQAAEAIRARPPARATTLPNSSASATTEPMTMSEGEESFARRTAPARPLSGALTVRWCGVQAAWTTAAGVCGGRPRARSSRQMISSAASPM
jgi:hypothetical protein